MRIVAGLTITSNADAAVVNHTDNQTYFVKPLERDEPFTDFIRDIRAQEFSDAKEISHVKYSQAREFAANLSEQIRIALIHAVHRK